MFKYFLYKFGQFLVNHLPSKVCYRMAMFISDMQYFFSFRDRNAVKKNLSIILGQDDEKVVPAIDVFRNFGVYLVEFFQMGGVIKEEYMRDNIKVENLVYLQEVLKKGKGGIVLTAHIGNWELGAATMSRLGYSVTAVALPHKERPVNDLFNSQREKQGIKVLSPARSVRECINELKNNKLIALVGDRDFSFKGEIVDFFGKKTSIPKGPAVFSLLTGCAIIPCFLIRESFQRYVLKFCDPISPDDKDMKLSNYDKMKNIIERYVAVIENEIKAYPTQWLMFRPFWIDERAVNN